MQGISDPIVPSTYFTGAQVKDSLSLGTLDITGNSNKGVVTLRAPDWGTESGQWEMWFPNYEIWVINSRPVNSLRKPWYPHDEPNVGQPIDVAKDTYTVHDLPSDWEVCRVDFSSYTSADTGENSRSAEWTVGRSGLLYAPTICADNIKYPVVEGSINGCGEVIGGNGSTFTLGPGEVQILKMRQAS